MNMNKVRDGDDLRNYVRRLRALLEAAGGGGARIATVETSEGRDDSGLDVPVPLVMCSPISKGLLIPS